ncbi:hypothetical protein MYCSP_22365 [Mycobacteroides saopaulense]|uniref:hypothetical protein n=1 Tax=Mycobacteroides saopaulense TaxID=1578165 RepID=UPI000720EE09|nr:hypothetical protein [Mycobacteroides saopaulense]ALR13703.1 hypothetical protein MYCSP_22365 [Mycobacteroides saopaulense]
MVDKLAVLIYGAIEQLNSDNVSFLDLSGIRKWARSVMGSLGDMVRSMTCRRGTGHADFSTYIAAGFSQLRRIRIAPAVTVLVVPSAIMSQAASPACADPNGPGVPPAKPIPHPVAQSGDMPRVQNIGGAQAKTNTPLGLGPDVGQLRFSSNNNPPLPHLSLRERRHRS